MSNCVPLRVCVYRDVLFKICLRGQLRHTFFNFIFLNKGS
ncbi:hypothetical protein SSP2138 [Staphylococcus saprophyticus subsp. saprophyticus ATCC 15305]|uniref:Uncharacterized protein n=1 Tax=Staphylococcus saprophyticus subsp. saprophyticus (strain ATCC 15305 / DSM 20229 / NCIMB 8711 / NCTC 7292 / S-41) TaxID=342451 RepID=Q49VC7_STAS1|nr:hypothetical protein SSP2138 [Staphylococcus saprophyticus subsp. saprophyticus ATCC 15305] [Staphylococcus saprophyticus subsp. saprophyticus ATCC 15305 = NCTC 7292]